MTELNAVDPLNANEGVRAVLIDRLSEMLGADGLLTDPAARQIHSSDLLDEGPLWMAPALQG